MGDAHNVLSSRALLSSCRLRACSFFHEDNPSHNGSSSFSAAFYVPPYDCLFQRQPFHDVPKVGQLQFCHSHFSFCHFQFCHFLVLTDWKMLFCPLTALSGLENKRPFSIIMETGTVPSLFLTRAAPTKDCQVSHPRQVRHCPWASTISVHWG